MYFDSVTELLVMAGHGVYVWSAYAITTAGLIGLIIYPLRRKQQLLFAVKQRQKFERETA
ncbi:MAG TPA: heme exporter protein CcmD [Pseudomonadales bacterium]